MITNEDLETTKKEMERNKSNTIRDMMLSPLLRGSIVTLIGSTKQPNNLRKWARYFTILGDHVFMPLIPGQDIWRLDVDSAVRRRIRVSRMDQINRSLMVMVVNDHQSIGVDSVDEILFAMSLKKEIYFSELPKKCADDFISLATKAGPFKTAEWRKHTTYYGVSYWILDYTW